MMLKCNYCETFTVDDTENEAVCLTCGIVASDTGLADEHYTPAAPSTFVPYTRFEVRIRGKKKPAKTLLHGLHEIEELCKKNNMKHPNLIADTIAMFKHLCSIRNFRTTEDAGVTAACCLFLVLRKNDIVIQIKTICHQLECARGKFSHYLNFVKSYIRDHPDSPFNVLKKVNKDENPEDGQSVSMAPTIREVCRKAEAEEKSILMEKTAALLKLAEDCWLLTGRSPRSVVVACAYLCWKSMKLSRKKASYPKFCRSLEISEPVAKLRIKELRAFLLKLGKKIPHYNPDYVNEDNLLLHLNTILENSESLRNDLLPDTHAREAVNCKEYTTFRFPPESNPRKEPLTSVDYGPDMNASDIEISDTEIESYIRSDTKKKVVELCKMNDFSDSESESSIDSEDGQNQSSINSDPEDKDNIK